MAKKFDSDTTAEIINVHSAKNESVELLTEFKLGLIKLGLKGSDDLNHKRVQNPTEFYNSLTALFNAVKNS